MTMLRTKILVTLAVGMFASSTMAAELSMLSGLYKTEKSKVSDDDAGGQTAIQVGARYGDKLEAMLEWFAQSQLVLRSYDAPEGGEAPSNSTSIFIGGGVRSYFDPITENTAPFITGWGEYRNDKNAENRASTTYVESEDSGLFYGSSLGLRMGLNADFFVDFETALFTSALFATEKSETVTTTTDATTGVETTTKTERETSRTELFADTSGAFQNMLVSLGMRF
jgi:hypothetical protein